MFSEWQLACVQRAQLHVPKRLRNGAFVTDMSQLASWRVSAAELEVRQRGAARWLRSEGAVTGDRLAIVAGNHPDVIAMALGALRTGVIPVMINAALLPAERDLILGDCQPVVVLSSADEIRARITYGCTSTVEVEIAAVPLGRPMHYTSGTTGRPKGVWSGVLSVDDAHALLAEEREQWQFAATDINLVVSPLYHSAPLRFATGTLFAGGEIVVLEKFSPESAAAAINTHRPTTAFMAPAHLQRLLDPSSPGVDVSSFRLLAHAGAPCPSPLKQHIVSRFPEGSVWEFYGSTEGQFTVCSTEDWRHAPGSVGRARPGRTLHIDAETNVIWCEVPSYARFSYFGDPDRTTSTWRGTTEEPEAKNSFSVFDIGRLDEDGYLYLDGRRDDLIITGGVNVYPLECEIVLAELVGVAEVAVYPVDDEQWGQQVCAAIVRDSSPAGAALTVDHVRAHMNATLAPYKRPKTVVFVDAIPRTPTGKVRRSLLHQELGLPG
jgi:long-chain acyl-CoA synthetase